MNLFDKTINVILERIFHGSAHRFTAFVLNAGWGMGKVHGNGIYLTDKFEDAEGFSYNSATYEVQGEDGENIEVGPSSIRDDRGYVYEVEVLCDKGDLVNIDTRVKDQSPHIQNALLTDPPSVLTYSQGVRIHDIPLPFKIESDTDMIDIYIAIGWGNGLEDWAKKHNIPGLFLHEKDPELEPHEPRFSQYVIWDTSKLKIARRHVINH